MLYTRFDHTDIRWYSTDDILSPLWEAYETITIDSHDCGLYCLNVCVCA